MPQSRSLFAKVYFSAIAESRLPVFQSKFKAYTQLHKYKSCNSTNGKKHAKRIMESHLLLQAINCTKYFMDDDQNRELLKP